MNIFTMICEDGSETVINLELISFLKIEENKITIKSLGENCFWEFKTKEAAKSVYNKIKKLLNDEDEYDDDDEDEDEDYRKPDSEKILSERVNQMLDLLNSKNNKIKELHKEIEELKNEKKGFINKIKNLVQRD